ncbi:proteinase-activated receptor 2-like [Anguilla anguilla]|uniref:proteinase-activated receptor 2-like n=1 Tax=Anguilla anguilla TaxID=7936 RepID=UPI0015AC4C98|nr:proteinase-activated receptor 2-like [Anguilla anguilla]XP_035258944.1 proteinase-activated receptor 2-like [Anguilla anguilla]XP_035258945.1 proteinase-activated receptor 2-like [Anguilla anguilla]
MNESKVNGVDERVAYVDIFEDVIAWIIFCFGLPAICLASYALYRLIKANHVAPIYVINLLISDLVQIIVRIFFMTDRFFGIQSKEYIVTYNVLLVVVRFGLIASLGFMVCISLERYLVVVHPLWYRYYRNIKHSVLASLVVWVLSVIYAAIDYNVLMKDHITFTIVFSILFLLPMPLLVFLYVGTRRALAGTVSVSDAEKKRIMGILVLVLGIYVLLYLPFTLMSFYLAVTKKKTFTVYCLMAVTRNIVRLSPLVDPFLYIFMRKDAKDTVEVFPCCQTLIASGRGWSRSKGTTSETISSV